MKQLNQIKSVARLTSTALLTVLMMFSANSAKAQTDNVGIGTTTPDNSSILDLTSTSRGFLTPRMTSAQRDAIATPVTGLIIYQTNNTPGFYYYDGSAWSLLASSSSGVITGSGTSGQLSFWNSTSTISGDNDLFWDNTNKILGIGTDTPSSTVTLDVLGNVLITGDLEVTGEIDPISLTLIPQAASPTAVKGKLYYDNSANELKIYDGSAWNSIGSGGGGGGGDVSSVNGADGRIAVFNSSSTITGSDAFFWDRANARLGIGTNTPEVDLDVVGTAILGAPTAAPADGNFAVSQWTLWIDEASDEFELKAKKSDGSVISQTVGSGGGGTPAGNSGEMQFNNAGAFGASSNLFWDNANDRIGVGNSAPVERVDLRDASGNGGIRVANSVIAQDGVIRWTGTDFEGYNGSAWASFTSSGGGGGGGGDVWGINGSNGRVAFFNSSTTITGTDAFYWDNINDRLGIGTNSPSTDLDVVGTVILGAPNAAPVDGDFAVSQWTLWLDEASDEFELKARKSDGTYISQTVSSGGSTSPAGNVSEIQFHTTGGVFGASADFIWDNTNSYLGIGSGAPTSVLDVVGGTVYLSAPAAEPADADIANTQWTMWLDEANDEFELKARKSDGTYISQTVGAGGSTSPAGADTQIQFNDAGSFGASANLIWDNTNSYLGIGSGAPTSVLDVVGGTVYLSAPAAEPADGDIADTQWTMWLDEVNDEFELKAKKSDGTVISQTIGSGGGGTPGGADTQIQFNNSSAFDGSADLIWDNTNSYLGIGAGAPTSTIDAVGGSALLPAPNAAPADGDLVESQWTFWIDETNDDFEIKAKKANGTVLTKTVAEGLVMSRTTGSQGGTASNTVSWDADVVIDSDYYTRSGTDITVAKSGIYRISYSVLNENGIGGRNIITVNVQENGTDLAGSRSLVYLRNDSDGQYSSNSNFFLANLTGGRVITVVCTGDGNFNILAETQITIERIR